MIDLLRYITLLLCNADHYSVFFIIINRNYLSMGQNDLTVSSHLGDPGGS